MVGFFFNCLGHPKVVAVAVMGDRVFFLDAQKE